MVKVEVRGPLPEESAVADSKAPQVGAGPARAQARTNSQIGFRVYDTSTGQPVALPARLRRLAPLRFAQFLSDGSLVVGNMLDPVLLRWSESTGTLEEISLPGTVFADLQLDNTRLGNIRATLSADGRRLAIRPDRNTVIVWDLEQKRAIGVHCGTQLK